MSQPIASEAPGGKIRGGTSGRSDPPQSSLDGLGNKTDVEGKDPAFHYCWLDPRHLKTQLNGWIVPDGAHAGERIAGFVRCKRSEESASWAGFASVRDGSSFSEEDICNGELILFKKPMGSYLIEQEFYEEQAIQHERLTLDDEGDGSTLRASLNHTRKVGNPMKVF